MLRLAGWSAIVAGLPPGVFIFCYAILITAVETYTSLHDLYIFTNVVILFQILLVLPVLLVLWQALRWHNTPLTIGATVIGLVGLLLAWITQALLVFQAPTDPQIASTTLIGRVLIGVWLIAINWLAWNAGLEQGVLPWLGIAAGVGYVVLVIGVWLGGEQSLLFKVGEGVTVLSKLLWAIWLGVLLIGGKVAWAT
jgi:hypothetical protein